MSPIKKSSVPKNIPVHQLPDITFLASDQSPTFGEARSNHRINFYAIVWFTEDAGTHYVDFEPYPIKKNSVFLLGKNQAHSIPAEKIPAARTIVFSTDFFENIDEPYLRQLFLPFRNDGIMIPEDMVSPLKHLFDLIILEYKGKADQMMLLEYTTAYLMHLHRFSQKKNNTVTHSDKRLEKLIHLVEENYKNGLPAEFYATEANLSTKQMNEILKKSMGGTLNQLIQHLLLIEAKRQLAHGSQSIKEIAYQLGFNEQSYFARFFKKNTGNSPETFRTKTKVPFN
jgi:AraC-like DNA-binding protein